MLRPVLPDPAWGPRLLCCFTLCLLGAGHMEAGITQNPRHVITETGEKVTLRCHQTYNYDYMYWYRQDPGQGLQLIHYSYTVNNTEKGEVPNGYKVSRSNTEDFPLTLEDSAVYLCASSLATAPVSHVGLGTQLTFGIESFHFE
uniref:Ig-like domain-containing protein n=1 Tax=Urocitellus parryii TaxID=9999 RepID=A0A8D2HGG4_UROPR